MWNFEFGMEMSGQWRNQADFWVGSERIHREKRVTYGHYPAPNSILTS